MLRTESRRYPIPEVLEDNRWGWTEYYIGIRGEPLLIHSAIRTCTGFIGRKVDGEERPIGTCFFLAREYDGVEFGYLVTAKHLIENTRQSDDQLIYLHFNSKDGGQFRPIIRATIDNWFYHPTDTNIDVAVLPFKPLKNLDHTAIPNDTMQERAANARWKIDIGTDVFITGLFLRHHGRQQHIPIVRTGTIAAMPGEPVEMGEPGEGKQVPAYLIETHSIGGLSGSPVFANPMTIGANENQIRLEVAHIWIGVVSGHWQFDEDARESNNLNSGIAIVATQRSVIEVLDHPQLAEMRKEEIQRRKKGTAPKMDDAGEPATQKTRAPKEEDRMSIPIPTRGQFERDLAKATRKRDK